MLEFFAGRGRVTEAFRSNGHLTAKFDIKYHNPKSGKSNFMDLTTASGFLLLACIICRSSLIWARALYSELL